MTVTVVVDPGVVVGCPQGVATARTATARGAKAESLENMLRDVLCRSY